MMATPSHRPVGPAPPSRRCIALIAAGWLALLESPAAGQSKCGTTRLASGTAERVLDPKTIGLTDGREVRMAGIAAPSLPRPGKGRDPISPWEAGARMAIEQTAIRHEISLTADQPAPDRYGRWEAFVFVKREGLERLLQRDMLALGLALVAPRVGAPDCARELLAAEREARAAGVGLWANPDIVRGADQPDALLNERGRLTLVEGRVLSVRESGGTIYVNFGRRWSEDFTVTIPKRDERRFIAAGMPPKMLDRRRVRVRGFIEERGGPWIEARNAEQIELLQD